MSDTIHKRGWDLLCPHMRPERAEKILTYAREYFEPVLSHFPELFGKVYLALRKYGWLAEYQPVLHIVIQEEALDTYSPWELRTITAHELMHLIQFTHGIGLERYGTRDVERQATFLTFARGFAYDFLRTFTSSCPHHPCSHSHRSVYFNCNLIFKGCCRIARKRSCAQRQTGWLNWRKATAYTIALTIINWSAHVCWNKTKCRFQTTHSFCEKSYTTSYGVAWHTTRRENTPSFAVNWQCPLSLAAMYRMLCVPSPCPAALVTGNPFLKTGVRR